MYPPIRQISDVTYEEVRDWFRLCNNPNDQELQSMEEIRMPDDLGERAYSQIQIRDTMLTGLVRHLTLIQNAINVGSGPVNEASVRMILDALLIHAHEIALSRRSPHGQHIAIQKEKMWGIKIGPTESDSGLLELRGRPAYACWYGSVEETELNIVIFEAKASGECGLAQCLAYMGMWFIILLQLVKSNLYPGIVHQKRKDAEKRDCTVYGVCYSHVLLAFLKIDNQSRLSSLRIVYLVSSG